MFIFNILSVEWALSLFILVQHYSMRKMANWRINWRTNWRTNAWFIRVSLTNRRSFNRKTNPKTEMCYIYNYFYAFTFFFKGFQCGRKQARFNHKQADRCRRKRKKDSLQCATMCCLIPATACFIYGALKHRNLFKTVSFHSFHTLSIPSQRVFYGYPIIIQQQRKTRTEAGVGPCVGLIAFLLGAQRDLAVYADRHWK